MIDFEDITPELLVDLTKEALKEYPIDWGMMQVDENEFMKLACIDVLDRFGSLDEKERQIAMLSSITCLILENFYLNMKLQKH
jgi:hypothetical protein